MLDAVRAALEVTRENLKACENRITNPPKEKIDTPWSYWNEQKDSFRAWLAETSLKPYIELKVKEQEAKAEDEPENKNTPELRLERCRDLVRYFEEVERALIDHGAKTWAEINPMAAAAQEILKTDVVSPQTYGTPPYLATQNVADPDEFLAKHYKAPSVPLLFVLNRAWSPELASVHTIPLYEELLEACWKGNNERIKELCLPPKTGKRNSDPEYLQITCDVQFNPRIPVQPCLDDNVAAEISTFKEYPSTVPTWGKSISHLSGHFVTPWKVLLLCTLLSFLGTGKPQRSSLRSQWLNTRHPPARRLTTLAVVSHSCVPHLISHFYLRRVRCGLGYNSGRCHLGRAQPQGGNHGYLAPL